jgi:hypothetical protein
MAKAELIRELWAFMKTRKRYWLAPIVVVMVLLGLMIILAETSAVAPFIYTLF